jgi:succinoglycan biosynthesis transport protein ExoP
LRKDDPEICDAVRHRARHHEQAGEAAPMTSSHITPSVASSSAIGSPTPFHGLGAPNLPEPEGGLDWQRVSSALLRFKWLIVIVTLVGTAAGVVAARFLSRYAAQATIWIDQSQSERRGGTDRGPIRPGQLLDPQAWVDLLKSYVVLDQVVHDQRLFLSLESRADQPAFVGFQVSELYRPGTYRVTVDGAGRGYVLDSKQGMEIERGTVGDSIGRRLGFRWAPEPGALASGRRVEFTVATLRDASRSLAQDVDATMDLEGNFLRIELQGPDPTDVTTVVNALAERYVKVAADLKRQKLSELTKILDEQVQAAHKNLQDAEQGLERFRVQTITLPSDRPGPSSTSLAGASGANAPVAPTDRATEGVFGSFFDMQVDREQARRDGDALRRLLAQGGDSGLSVETLGIVGSVQRSPELAEALKELTGKQAQLRALRYRYADEYPPVQRLSGEIATLERQTIPTLARALMSQLAARDAELSRRLDADSRSLRAIPPRAIDEARLRRGVSLAENLYTTLQQRYDEARLAEASTIPDVRILDSAVVPQRPVKDTALRFIALGFVASLGCAAVGAVLLDRVDPRVRYPTQVSRELGLAILGAVPHMRTASRSGRQGRAADDVNQVVEALRGVCLNLVYAHGGRAPLLVTLTSPGAGDGKSFLAANLAHTFADGGHRVLLVDGDIRRGVLHRRLSARRRPGLSDYLRGEAPFDAIVQATPYPSLSLIGCGTRAYNAPELLGSPAMSELVNGMRSGYEVILIDSPPLTAGVDPLILSTLTGTLAVVLRTGYSHRDVAAAKLEVLQRLPVRLLGAILNDVPAGGAYRYYSYYLPGYEAMDEDSGGRRVPV